MANQINSAFLQLPQRAEKYYPEYLVSTFVEVGDVFTLLKTRENHILYGRRGTGKSHILIYLKSQVEKEGDIWCFFLSTKFIRYLPNSYCAEGCKDVSGSSRTKRLPFAADSNRSIKYSILSSLWSRKSMSKWSNIMSGSG